MKRGEGAETGPRRLKEAVEAPERAMVIGPIQVVDVEYDLGAPNFLEEAGG